MKIDAGSTNVSVYYYIVQDASATSPGEPVTGLLFSDIETGGSASYVRQGAARTDLTLITLASASATHADGGFILVDDTNMPGLYRCDYPDAAFASGVDQTFLSIVVASANNAVAAPILVDIEASIAQTADHTAGIADIPTVAEFNARTLVAASYFDPAADAVANVTLVATTTTNTDMRGTDGVDTATMRGTDSANTVVPPSVAQFNARTILAASYFDPAADAVANVTLTATTTTLTNKTGFSLASTGLDAIVSTATGMVEIAKAIWDRVLTGATHNINNSAGKRLRGVSGEIFEDGTAQSGGNNSIQLASGDVTINEQFVSSKVIIVGGTGTAQEAIITSSVASTDTLTITPTWLVNPDATSEYQILPAQVHSTVRNGGYDNASVFIDTVNGAAGTEKGVNGTSTNPVSNLTDAYVIAANEMLTKFDIAPGSAITLPSDSSDKQFVGSLYTVALNGQEIGDSTFTGASQITGIGINTANGPPAFFTCGIGTVTLPPSNGFEVGFFGTFTIGSEGTFTYGGSASLLGLGLTLDYGVARNASQFALQSWGGGTVEIQNAGAGTGTYELEMNAIGGHLVINANCSATTNVDLHGSIQFTNNATGITVNDQSGALRVDLETVDTNVDSILVDTGTTLPALIDDLAIKKNTAFSNFEFLMVLTSDGRTPATGLTVTGQRSIDGASFATVGGTIAEVSNGIYQFDALAADTNGDVITWRFTSATADDTFVTFKTVA